MLPGIPGANLHRSMKTPETTQALCLLRQGEVLRRTGLSRTSLWRLARRGEFPAPVHFGRSAFWSSHAVDDWVRSVVDCRSAGGGS